MMDEGRLPQKIMKLQPKDLKNKDRPKLTWMVGIEGMMVQRGPAEGDRKTGIIPD